MEGLIPTSDLPTAVAAIVISFGVAAVYFVVAYRLFLRPVSEEARIASYQFSLWWGGLGASVALSGVEVALAVFNVLPFALALTLGLLSVAIDCAFLWGLVGFLTYVYTGRYHILEVSAFYFVFYVAALYYLLAQGPYALGLQAGLPTVLYSMAPNSPLMVLILLGILVPEIVGATLYLSLLGRTSDPTARYRILLVGTSILLWFAVDAFFPASTSAWMLAKSVIEVIPGLMSLMAFFPPAWATRRYGVAGTTGYDRKPPEAAAHP